MLANPDPLAEALAVSLYEEDPDTAEGVLAEFQRGWERELVMSHVRQARIAEASARIERASVEGIGQMTMEIDPFVFHYWGQKLGYDCWCDDQFRREFRRDNPEVRVNHRPRHETIVKSRVLLTDRRGNVMH